MRKCLYYFFKIRWTLNVLQLFCTYGRWSWIQFLDLRPSLRSRSNSCRLDLDLWLSLRSRLRVGGEGEVSPFCGVHAWGGLYCTPAVHMQLSRPWGRTMQQISVVGDPRQVNEQISVVGDPRQVNEHIYRSLFSRVPKSTDIGTDGATCTYMYMCIYPW